MPKTRNFLTMLQVTAYENLREHNFTVDINYIEIPDPDDCDPNRYTSLGSH